MLRHFLCFFCFIHILVEVILHFCCLFVHIFCAPLLAQSDIHFFLFTERAPSMSFPIVLQLQCLKRHHLLRSKMVQLGLCCNHSNPTQLLNRMVIQWNHLCLIHLYYRISCYILAWGIPSADQHCRSYSI